MGTAAVIALVSLIYQSDIIVKDSINVVKILKAKKTWRKVGHTLGKVTHGSA